MAMAELIRDKSRPGSPRPSVDQRSSNKVKTETSVIIPPIRSRSRAVSDRVKDLLMSLSRLDSLYLCPITEPLPDEVTANIRGKPVRKYEIKDYYGQTRYYAAEMTHKCTYRFCSNNRTFKVFMYNPAGDLVFESARPCTTGLCICGVDCCCCVNGVETEANFRHQEHYIGSVVTGGSCLTPSFIIQNDDFDEKLYVIGPQCSLILPCRLCCISSFSICVPTTEVSVGKIMYGYDGLNEDLVPNPKTVGVIFPPRCTPEIKALLLAAGFMLEITYFQDRGCTLQRILRQTTVFIIIFVIIGLVLYVIHKPDELELIA